MAFNNEKVLSVEELKEFSSRVPKTIEEMNNPIKTNVSAEYFSLFRTFLDANDMTESSLGYYTDFDSNPLAKVGYGENKLCYSLKTSFLVESNIMYMNIKYGSLENAFNDFNKECRRRKI